MFFTGIWSPITTFEDEFKKAGFPIKHPGNDGVELLSYSLATQLLTNR
jgi:hypothetical protein